ncbi:MAG: AI-2E family transporter [Acidimicrobiaceae bacterium]|nr:AI-2E family transporter [Acidimicrobiaceae bacterium]
MVAAMDDRRTVPVWVKRAIVGFWVGGLLTFYAVGVIRALGTLIVVLIVSVFVAFALEPAVNAMARRGIRRGFSTAIAFLVVAVAAAGFSALVGTALASETTYLIDKAPGYIDDIEGWLDDTFGIEVEFDTLKDEFLAGGGAQDLASRFADDVVNAGATVVSLLFHLFTVALFTFYLVAEGPKLRQMVSSRLSERRAAIVTEIWDLAMQKTGGYMYSRTILALISAFVHWVAFVLIDVPSPVALAIWVGVISQFIPAIGAYIAGVLPVLVALLHEPRAGLFVLIVIVAYQQLENYFLSPRVTAHTMEIHVALAFGSVIAGTALLGIVGAFLALPVAATAQAFITSWLDQRTGPDGSADAGPADTEPAGNESVAGEPAEA